MQYTMNMFPLIVPYMPFLNPLFWLVMAFCVSMRKYKGTIVGIKTSHCGLKSQICCTLHTKSISDI